jgi:hypothetical protein
MRLFEWRSPQTRMDAWSRYRRKMQQKRGDPVICSAGSKVRALPE